MEEKVWHRRVGGWMFSGSSALCVNAKVMSERFLELGVKLVSGGTDNHLMLVDLRNFNITGKDFEKMLEEVIANINLTGNED